MHIVYAVDESVIIEETWHIDNIVGNNDVSSAPLPVKAPVELSASKDVDIRTVRLIKSINL